MAKWIVAIFIPGCQCISLWNHLPKLELDAICGYCSKFCGRAFCFVCFFWHLILQHAKVVGTFFTDSPFFFTTHNWLLQQPVKIGAKLGGRVVDKLKNKRHNLKTEVYRIIKSNSNLNGIGKRWKQNNSHSVFSPKYSRHHQCIYLLPIHAWFSCE